MLLMSTKSYATRKNNDPLELCDIIVNKCELVITKKNEEIDLLNKEIKLRKKARKKPSLVMLLGGIVIGLLL